MNSIAVLVDNALSYNEKIPVKNLKRPMPHLNLENKQCVKGKEIIRKFKMDLYQRNDWICGCDIKNALFCFPCVLFGGEPSWAKNGIRDLIHLSAKISKHENSEEHLRNAFSLSMLGKNNIQSVLDSSYRRAIEKHNEEVTKNRHVLNLIINSIRFCGAFEQALEDHDERQTLIKFTTELDKSLKDHIEGTPVFKGLSKTLVNELFEVMLTVYREQVANEIKVADHIAMIAAETTDVSNQFQLVIVLRYITKGRPVERFWKVLMPNGHDAVSLSSCLLNEMSSLVDDSEKLIAQSYDGVAVMSGDINDVQRRVQDQYPEANFVNSYSHQTTLNLISYATSSNSNCRIFFANLSGLCTFFSTSPQRAAELEEFLRRKSLPRSSKLKWNFNSRTLNIVYKHREEIIEALEEIEREANLQTTIQQAGAHLRILEDEIFIYWLGFFHRIMPHVDILFKQLKIKNNLDDFERAIGEIRSEVDNIDDQFVEETDSKLHLRPSKRRRLGDENERRRETIEVCDIIMLEIKTRFQFTGHLLLSHLVSFKQFPSFEVNFPEDCLKEAVNFYPCLNETRLRTELSVLYSREEFRKNSNTSAVGLLALLLDGMSNTFYEVIKLLKIIITIPMTTCEAERQLSRLKRIKTFFKNTTNEDGLNLEALIMLSCEKEFINGLTKFNERVIELFCNSKMHTMAFTYRQI